MNSVPSKSWSPLKQKVFQLFGGRSLVLSELRGFNSKNLSFLADLPNLEKLSLEFPSRSLDVSVLERCKKLADLSIAHRKIRTPVELAKLPNLRKLWVEFAPQLNSLYNCKSLEELTIFNWNESNLDCLQSLKQLKKLTIHKDTSLESLKGLSKLDNLQVLELTDCSNLTDISEFSNLARMITLRVDDKKIYRQADLTPEELELAIQKFGRDRVDTTFRR